MTYALRIAHDLNRSARSLSGYDINLTESDAVPSPLAQHGPVWNNQIVYRGTFADRESAIHAALSYINAPCRLMLRQDHFSGDERIFVQALGARRASETAVSYTVLGSRSAKGDFVARAA